MHEPPAQPDSAGDHAINGEVAIQLESQLDDCMLRREVGVSRIANDEVVDLLRPQANAIEMVAGGHSPPREFPLKEMGRERSPLDPDEAYGKHDQRQRAKG